MKEFIGYKNTTSFIPFILILAGVEYLIYKVFFINSSLVVKIFLAILFSLLFFVFHSFLKINSRKKVVVSDTQISELTLKDNYAFGLKWEDVKKIEKIFKGKKQEKIILYPKKNLKLGGYSPNLRATFTSRIAFITLPSYISDFSGLLEIVDKNIIKYLDIKVEEIYKPSTAKVIVKWTVIYVLIFIAIIIYIYLADKFDF